MHVHRFRRVDDAWNERTAASYGTKARSLIELTNSFSVSVRTLGRRTQSDSSKRQRCCDHGDHDNTRDRISRIWNQRDPKALPPCLTRTNSHFRERGGSKDSRCSPNSRILRSVTEERENGGLVQCRWTPSLRFHLLSFSVCMCVLFYATGKYWTHEIHVTRCSLYERLLLQK